MYRLRALASQLSAFVADGPYSLAEVAFAINPTVSYVAQGIADSTGAVQFGDVGVRETAIGGPFATNAITTENFGGLVMDRTSAPSRASVSP